MVTLMVCCSSWMIEITLFDIIFIKNNRITKIHDNCPPCKESRCQSYKGSGDLVLELPGGTCKKYGITNGDPIELGRD